MGEGVCGWEGGCNCSDNEADEILQCKGIGGGPGGSERIGLTVDNGSTNKEGDLSITAGCARASCAGAGGLWRVCTCVRPRFVAGASCWFVYGDFGDKRRVWVRVLCGGETWVQAVRGRCVLGRGIRVAGSGVSVGSSLQGRFNAAGC